MGPAYVTGCAAALCDITAASSIALSVTEPQWAQSFWDRSSERTCCFQSCFQGSAIASMARRKAPRRRRQNIPGSSGSQAVGEDHQVPAEEMAAGGHRYEMGGTCWGHRAPASLRLTQPGSFLPQKTPNASRIEEAFKWISSCLFGPTLLYVA